MTESSWRDHSWCLIDGESQPPAMHMALDEVLTRRVGAGERAPTLRFWRWAAPAVVLGRFQSVRNEGDEEAAREHGIRIVRRMTGGGAISSKPRTSSRTRSARRRSSSPGCPPSTLTPSSTSG